MLDVRQLATVLACAFLMACTGAIATDGDDPQEGGSGGQRGGSDGMGTGARGGAPPAGSSLVCSEELVHQDAPLRRLSRTQVRNAVNDALAHVLGSQAADVEREISQVLASLPEEDPIPPNSFGALGFNRSDQFLTQDRADKLYAVAEAVAAAVGGSGARLTAAFGTCATDASHDNDGSCAGNALQRWGARLLRHPLTKDDVQFFARPVDPARGGDSPARGFGEVLGLLIASPSFVFLLEGGATSPDAPEAKLSAYELASRLAFLVTDAPPDEALWAKAVDGSLLDETTLESEVDRLFTTARAREVRDHFFNEWLGLDHHTADPLIRVATSLDWAAHTKDALPPSSARQEMIDDVIEMTRFVFEGNQPVRELLTNRQAFARSAWLARVYATPVWDGKSEAPEPDQVFAGLLTRPAFTASGEVDTRPIRKGVRVRNELLCDAIPAPPPGAAGTTVEKGEVLTTRERYQRLTESPNSPCRGCHAELINPLGFVTEGFDGMGRPRQQEIIYGEDGKELARRPVDTASQYVDPAGVAINITDGGTLAAAIGGRFDECAAKQYLRFASAKPQEGEADGCRLLGMLSSGNPEDGSAANMMKAYYTAPEFRLRVFSSEPNGK